VKDVYAVIYGNIKTNATIRPCLNRPIPLAFIGPPPEKFEILRRKSEKMMNPVGFSSDLSGYFVKDDLDHPIFLVVSASGVSEIPINE
jgi:hypothetical protein